MAVVVVSSVPAVIIRICFGETNPCDNCWHNFGRARPRLEYRESLQSIAIGYPDRVPKRPKTRAVLKHSWNRGVHSRANLGSPKQNCCVFRCCNYVPITTVAFFDVATMCQPQRTTNGIQTKTTKLWSSSKENDHLNSREPHYKIGYRHPQQTTKGRKAKTTTKSDRHQLRTTNGIQSKTTTIISSITTDNEKTSNENDSNVSSSSTADDQRNSSKNHNNNIVYLLALFVEQRVREHDLRYGSIRVSLYMCVMCGVCNQSPVCRVTLQTIWIRKCLNSSVL